MGQWLRYDQLGRRSEKCGRLEEGQPLLLDQFGVATITFWTAEPVGIGVRRRLKFCPTLGTAVGGSGLFETDRLLDRLDDAHVRVKTLDPVKNPRAISPDHNGPRDTGPPSTRESATRVNFGHPARERGGNPTTADYPLHRGYFHDAQTRGQLPAVPSVLLQRVKQHRESGRDEDAFDRVKRE